MLKVDAAFMAQLRSDNVSVQALADEQQPPRTWHAEKLQTFLNKLKAQTTHEAPVPGS